MNTTQKAWIDFLNSYEEYENLKDSCNYCYYTSPCFIEYKAICKQLGLDKLVKKTWNLRNIALKNGKISYAHKKVLREYAHEIKEYKKDRNKRLAISRKENVPYKKLRNNKDIKYLWELRRYLMQIANKD